MSRLRIIGMLLTLTFLAGALGAEPGSGGEATESWAWWLFFGRFHPVVLHLPIGFLLIAFFLDVYSMFRRSPDLRRAAYLVTLLSALSAILATILGFLLASDGGYDEQTLALHQWTGVIVSVLATIVALLQKSTLRREKALGSRLLHRFLLLVTLGVLAVAGHSGGDLTHGTDFLTKHAPPAVRSWVEKFTGPQETGTLTAGNWQETFFVETIYPIFEAKCFQCHGPKRQRGDFRMDTKEGIFTPGESELPSVVPGEPMRSQLVRLILLPVDHRDVMPPEGKEQLTAEEIIAIIHWIQEGAVYVEKSSETMEVAAADSASNPGGEGNPDTSGSAATGALDSQSSGGVGPTASESDDPEDDPPIVVPEGPIDFVEHVKPIFEMHCVSCHGDRRGKGEYRMHTREDAFGEGDFLGPAIVPGEPEKSSVYTTMSIPPEEDVDELLMPPLDEGGPLSAEAIEVIRRWITEGAKWPEGIVLTEED